MGDGLIIFDCDGVLVDSECIAADVFLYHIRAAGGVIDEADAYTRFLGRTSTAVHRILREEYDVAFTGPQLERMQADLYERLRHDLQPTPGIRDALANVNGPRCVASSSTPERIRLELEVTRLLEHFEPHVYSASMVREGKPAPDLFLHAAAACGAAPPDCIVIEDSPSGVLAAQAAGMRVLAFTGGSHATLCNLATEVAALSPDATFDDMRKLPDLLAAFELT
ncbi:MAG: HAD-IA family hydrolase [Woeseiaceae bacterium]